jgi:hypothetical protein
LKSAPFAKVYHLNSSGSNIAWKGTKILSKMKEAFQILAGGYPKDRRFLLVILDVTLYLPCRRSIQRIASTSLILPR